MESYKENCRAQVRRSRKSKYCIEEQKMQRHIDRVNRQIALEMQLKVNKNAQNTKKERRRMKVQMQMMSAIGGTVLPMATGLLGAKALYNRGARLAQNIEEGAQNFNDMTANANNMISQLQNFVQATFDKLCVGVHSSMNIFAIVVDVIAAIGQICWVRPEHMVKSLIMSISAIFIRHGVDKLWSLMINYIRDSQTQMQDSEGGYRTIISKIVEYIGYAIAALVGSSMIQNGVVSKQTMDVFKSISSISMIIKTVKDLDHAFPAIFESIENWLYDHFGMIKKSELDTLVAGYTVWSEKVQALMQRCPESDETTSDKIVYDRETVLEVEQLFKDSVEIAKTINEKKLSKFSRHFMILSKYLERKFKETDMSGAFGGKPRTEPVIIWLYGEAGQGKSYLSNPFAMMIAKTLNSHIPTDRIFAEIYNRNVEQEYWDGYAGQTVVIYDDFGQKVDSSSDANPEFMEVIRAGNIAPFPLHMAALEDKRRARFQSKAIILSSNVEKPQINSLTFPDAFFRRITVQLKVICKEEFCYEAKPGVFRADVSKINKAKIEKGMHKDDLFTDCYQFIQTNPESGEEIAELNFEEVTEMIKARSLEKFNNTKQYIESCNRFIANIQGADDFLEAEEMLEIDEVDETLKYYVKGKIMSGMDLIYSMIDGVEYFKSEVEVFKSKSYKVITRTLEKAAEELKIATKKTIEFVKENKQLIFLGVTSTVIAGLATFGIWKYMVTPKERVVKIADGLGCKDLTRAKSDAVLGAILKGEEKIILSEKRYNKMEKQIMEVCDKTDKYVSVCVVSEAMQSGDSITKTQKVAKIEAKQSGDSLTKSAAVAKIEAFQSGDAKTVDKANIVIEAHASGDNVTRTQKTIKIEATQSGDALTKTNKIAKIEVQDHVEASMQMWKDEQAQVLITNRIWSNMYRISGVVDEENIKPLLNGLFVRSRLMLVPGHLLDFLYRYSKLYIENLTGESYTIPLKDISVIRIKDRRGEDKEAALLVFPRSVKVHCDLTKHFSDGESMSMYRRADIALPLIRYGKSVGNMFATILGNTECVAYDEPIILDDADKGEYVLRTGLRYKANTIAGDCGAPIIVNETCVLRKIAGIHVAGAKDGSAFAESITQADLNRAFVHVGPNDKIIFDPDMTPNLEFFKFKSELQLNEHYDRENVIEAFGLPCDNFAMIGKATKTAFAATKTTLRPSIISGDVTEPTTKPCYLYHPEVDMYFKNLQKCAAKTPYIEGSDLTAAVNDVKKQLFANTDRRLARILTDEECIQGSDDSEYIGPVCRSTSAGYPWVLERAAGTKGKQAWLGDGEYKYDEKLKKAVDERIARAKQGIRTPVVWTDTLKDERRPIAKVESLKTRVFAHGPQDFTLAFRKYFLGFIAHIMENRISNEQSIGTNVYARDWAQTAKKLQSKGKKVIAGDFSTFDGTLNTGILARFADVVSDWYDDGEENRVLRNVFMQDIFNSMHLVHDTFYQMNHSQPSGNPATTILNSFYNSVSMRMVFLRCARRAGQPANMRYFNENVSMVSYGDDNVVNMSDRVVQWFNQNTITPGYAEIGMIYTDEGKTGGATPDYRSIGEVGYLKRNFIKRGNRWFAPLDIATITEMCNWMRGDIDPKTATQVNCECAIMELSQHAPAIWNEYEPLISKAFFNRAGYMLDTLSYEEYEEKRLYDYFM
ncbi:putative non-structural polyprotein [Linepithema humile picorna-like virus 3]|nr:putative non-structural polyprotein [Linepithema humile picorna-like virus 3]